MAAGQAVDAFRVSKATLADVNQETLQSVNAESKQATEVFPGKYVSPFGEGVMKRVGALLERVDGSDREKLVAMKLGAGFDRSITSWRANAAGQAVVMAVHYYRDLLMHLDMSLSDDYGRAEFVDPARYEFFSIAVCSRAAAGAWTCSEEQLADVAARHKMTMPQERAERIALAGKIVELVLAGK